MAESINNPRWLETGMLAQKLSFRISFKILHDFGQAKSVKQVELSRFLLAVGRSMQILEAMN